MKNLANGVAAITGAGGGIGRALAITLAKRGCHLALADINQQGLEQTRALVVDYPIKTSLHVVDVTDPEQVNRFAEEAFSAHGRITILINNAGITLQKSFATHSRADWQRVIGINLMGVIYGCQAFLPYLKQADQGHIVNMSSLAGFMGLPMQSSYCATKAAVRALSESLYTELKYDGIGVTSVHPGAIKTDIMKATLAESDDMDAATKTMELAMRFALPVEVAAEKIVVAIEKNKQRLLIGLDSRMFEVLKRLLPSLSQKFMARMFARFKPA